MRERNLNQKISKTNKALRPPLEPAKTRASRKPKQLQPKRQKIPRQKGLSISYYLGYHLWSLLTSIGKITHVDAGKPPQKDGAQESAHSIIHPLNKSIESWINACAQLAEREELLESPPENIPSSARVFALRYESQPTTYIAPSNRSRYRNKIFRTSLVKCNIIIAKGDPPTELITRAKKITSQPYNSSEIAETDSK